jgi:hypothetical protein
MLARTTLKSLVLFAAAIAIWLPGSTASAVPLSPNPSGENAGVSPVDPIRTSASSSLLSGVLGALSAAVGDPAGLSGADFRATGPEPVIRSTNLSPDDDSHAQAAAMLCHRSTKRCDDAVSRLLCGSPAERDTRERSDTQQRDQNSPSGLIATTRILHAEMVSLLAIADASLAIAPHLLEIFHPPRCAQA